jgi:hypothetical protein
MKHKTSKKFLLNALFAIIAFGLLTLMPTGCQSDFEEVGQAKTEAKNFKTTIVSLNQITNGQKEIKNFIKATNAKASNSRGSIPGAKFDDVNIMQATDDKGNINYSTKFSYVNDPENVFYNFVVNVLASGQKNSYIFKYICDPQHFSKYKYSNYDYSNFVGITEMKNYVEPPIDTNPNSNNKRSGDCEPVLIPSPGTNASNNGGGGLGGSNTGVSIAPGTNTTIIGYTVNSYSPGVTSVSWGGNTTYAGSGTTSGSCHGSCISMSGGLFIFQFGEIINPHQHKVANPKHNRGFNPDCIKNTTPIGLVPVNNIITAGQDLKTILNLTRAQSRWLGGGYLAVDMLKYVLSNWSTEGFAFAKELIDYGINNNTTNSRLEIANILDILEDGKVDGKQVVVGPTTPITNMAEYLNVFDTSKEAIITIYADQPKTGSHDLFSPSETVGHAFISITQGIKVRTLGFYPQGSVESIIPNLLTLNPKDFLSTPGVFGNDQGHSFDVSLSLPLNPSGLASVIAGIILIAQNNPQYNLGSLNCTDLAISIFNSQVIMNVPNSESPGPWSGQTPGTLGEIIRDLDLPPGIGGILNTNGGYAPNNNPK